ncbi:hypothetical protein ACLOJK_024565 [Asimina triloba]
MTLNEKPTVRLFSSEPPNGKTATERRCPSQRLLLPPYAVLKQRTKTLTLCLCLCLPPLAFWLYNGVFAVSRGEIPQHVCWSKALCCKLLQALDFRFEVMFSESQALLLHLAMFTFKNFAQRVEEIEIDVYRNLETIKSEPSGGSSFFRDSLLQWRELNTAEDFISFYEEMMPWVQTLPQILLQKETILSKLLSRLKMEARLSLEPILRYVKKPLAISRFILTFEVDPSFLFFSASVLPVSDYQFLTGLTNAIITSVKRRGMMKRWLFIFRFRGGLGVHSSICFAPFQAQKVALQKIKWKSVLCLQNSPNAWLNEDSTQFGTRMAQKDPFSCALLRWATADDGDDDFFPIFFLQRIADAFVDLLKSGAERDPDILEQIFTSWSYIMMYLQKYLVSDAVLVLNRNVIIITIRLRYYPRDYVQEFMAEAISFLLRNAPNEQLIKGVRKIIFEVAKKPNPQRKVGVSSLLWHTMRGTSSRLHSKAEKVLNLLIDSSTMGICDKYSLGSETVVEVIAGALHRLWVELDPEELNSIWNCLIEEALVSITNGSFLHLSRLLSLLISTVQFSKKGKLFDYELIVLPLMEMVIMPLDGKKTAGEYHSEVVSRTLQLMSCLLDVLEDSSISAASLQWAPIFESKSLSLLTFIKGLLEKDPGVPYAFRRSIISAMNDLIEASPEEVLYLMLTLFERLQGKPLLSDDFEEVSEVKVLQICNFFQQTICDWTKWISDIAAGSDLYVLQVRRSNLAVLWGTVTCYPDIFGPRADLSFIKNLVHALDQLLTKEGDLEVKKAVDALNTFADNLALSDKAIRMSTLRILRHYKPVDSPPPMEDRHLQKKCEMEGSQEFCENSDINDVIQMLLLIEATPLSIATSRKIVVLISKIQMGLSGDRISKTYAPIVLNGIFGIFHIRFSQLWEPAIECLVILVSKCVGVVWNRFIQYLENFQLKYLASQDQQEWSSAESSMQSNALGDCFDSYVAPKSDSTPSTKVLVLLLQSLQKIPAIAESRSRQLIPLFFKLLGYNSVDIHSMDYNGHFHKDKEWRLVLKEWLNLLKLMHNPKSFCTLSLIDAKGTSPHLPAEESCSVIEDTTLTNTTMKQFKDLRSLCLKIISFVLNKYETHDFGTHFWSTFFMSVKPLIDSFKQEGSSSEKPSSLFSCFVAMSRSPTLVSFLDWEKNLVPNIFSILTVKAASDAIVVCVLNFVENLLNMDNDFGDQEGCTIKGIILPNVDVLIVSLHALFHGDKVSQRKILSQAKLIRELNARSISEIGEPDYDTRVNAYEKITPDLFSSLKEGHVLVILSHCVYDMSSEDLILRQSASRSLLSFILFAASILELEESGCKGTQCHDKAFTEDVPVADALNRSGIKHLINNFFLLHMSEAMCKEMSIQKEWISLLRDMILNLPGIPALDSCRPLCSDDAEVDFFNNILHLQLLFGPRHIKFWIRIKCRLVLAFDYRENSGFSIAAVHGQT